MTMNVDFKKRVAERNAIRIAAKLPILNKRNEVKKLRAARSQRIFETVFASQRHRFSASWTSRKSWFSGLSEYSKARSQVSDVHARVLRPVAGGSRGSRSRTSKCGSCAPAARRACVPSHRPRYPRSLPTAAIGFRGNQEVAVMPSHRQAAEDFGRQKAFVEYRQ